MKKYLMTWYGLTDFRASLGIEQTTGPVLGALLAEDYTDVVILGFTHPDKTENRADEFQQEIAEIEGFDPATTRQFIDLFSNTAEAHHHFNQWLEKQLRDVGKKVDVRFHPVGLTHLNDTEGIYEAATQSLNAVAASEGEKLVTLYLSPGTPVMAFVWAFAALRHPTLKKRLIASSQPGRPPERIVLPSEWLEWHSKQVRSPVKESNQYDVIFHLFGEQRMPSLLGVKQFSSPNHIFLNSKQYPATVMKQFMGESSFFEIPVDPFNPESIREKIVGLIDTFPSNARIGFNLTGGTKLMYAGALSACRKFNATPFYFDSRSNMVVDLNNFNTSPIKPIDSVDTFINLNGDELWISKPGKNIDYTEGEFEKRNSLTHELWLSRGKIAKLYKELSNFNDLDEPFCIEMEDISISLLQDMQAKIKINNKVYKFQEWPDFAKYLSGGWLEEYVYLGLKPLLDSGVIKDLRVGLEISIDDSKGYSFLSDQQLYQELDVTFTDGKSLYIVECKAGGMKSDHVMKLQNIVRYFGGISGRGVFACCFKSKNKVVNKKVQESSNLNLIWGQGLIQQIEAKLTEKKVSDE